MWGGGVPVADLSGLSLEFWTVVLRSPVFLYSFCNVCIKIKYLNRSKIFVMDTYSINAIF